MTELFRARRARPGVTLGVATAFPGIPDLRVRAGWRCASTRSGQTRRASTFARQPRRAREMRGESSGTSIRTSSTFTAASASSACSRREGLVRTPAVVSLQGVLGPVFDVPQFLRRAVGLGHRAQHASRRAPARPRARAGSTLDMRRGARQEARILGGGRGRARPDRLGPRPGPGS